MKNEIESEGDSSQIQITANGGINRIISQGNVQAEEADSERAVFATEGGSIAIDGTSIITAGAWEDNNAKGYQANNKSASLLAGTLDESKAVMDENKNIIFDHALMGENNVSSISLNYGAGSAVTGDIVAGYGGEISVTEKAGDAGVSTMAEVPAMTLRGNVLAANGGQVTLDLGAGSYWAGRADDYQDAASEEWRKTHTDLYKSIFSKPVEEGTNPIQMNGTVDVTLGQAATWDVMGQSWVTKLGGDGGIIDMRNTLGDESSTSHAVHIGTLNGNHTFVMDLNWNQHNISDMLYIYDTENSSGQQTVFLNSLTGVENMQDGDKLRFATVKTDKLSFTGEYRGEGGYDNGSSKVMVRDTGLNDMALTIGNEKYVEANHKENAEYNGEAFSNAKPGDEYVDTIYGDGSTNWYLTREKAEDELSDAGKTVIAMSKVNYSNAVYMDRLNKRMGEARYIDGDDGLWVRMRHDRIGKDDAFRSMNTMFELGYDWHAKGQKDGEHRQGVAFDYMRGTADYQNVAGDGDVRRAGVWLYDTWLGDKGHYSDYVVKYGRLSNDFDIYGRTTGEKISGDYDNDVWSVSAEYGRKKDIGNEWYFEPQVQAQYAYVTSADYTTSQGTKVELDGIDSLIGRAGFRLGRDTSEGNTVYFKADILHEFLGDQSIRAMDATGTLSTTYENEGTWYDVGFGFSHKMGEDSYLFLDVEHSFGNDNEDTYQVNIGLNRAF